MGLILQGFYFLSGKELRSLEQSVTSVDVSGVASQGDGAPWIHFECLQPLSLSAPEELISLFLSLIIPLRTGGEKGRSGDSGREWETGKQRERRRCRRTALLLWLWLRQYYCSFHRSGEKVRGTHAGFLSNTAETFMKSLRRQGAAGTIFSSKLIQLQWLLCL